MSRITDLAAIGEWVQTTMSGTWQWFNELNYQEWFIVLGITAAAGLLCMRGYGSRSNY